MPFVKRNNTNVIVGLFARPQPGVADEFMVDDDPEIAVFRATLALSIPEDTPLTAEDTERLLLGLPGVNQASIAQAKRDRGQAFPRGL